MQFLKGTHVLHIQNIKCSLRQFSTSTREKVYNARKLIGFANQDIFEVIADVRNYENFLPFCTKSTVLKAESTKLHANLEIGFPPIVENYTSIVALDKPNMVQAKCFDGRLFDYLETTWTFYPGLYSNPKTCIIDFSIKFRFKSVLYSHIASIFFDRLVQQMENAFLNETAKRYGKPSVPIYKLSPNS
ncbi:unnamed protein product [Diabrotica balteata]|uniref:Coenzyme Q-binding protein COQ10 START domain-containing protein n=1 Tax=Diabrotica balteata TaxID=107213 RepID=A0A9N9SPJ6_DIABA|nr:unnamed protein product [Diabrotica balteata]